MGSLAGTDPEQPPQVDVVRAGIEGIFRIDERAQFSSASGRRERGAQERGSAGRRGSGDLVQFAPAESAPQRSIERGRTRGEDPARGRRPGSALHEPRPEQLRERARISQEGCGHPSDLAAHTFSGKGIPRHRSALPSCSALPIG